MYPMRNNRGDDRREAYIEAVLTTVEQIPPGRVVSYGDVAAMVGSGGPRQVGHVMSHYGAAVCWWRVVHADGRPAPGLERRALDQLTGEGAPVCGDRVLMRLARWSPATTTSRE
jgi:alkylated DNA nucleotide flippase Atl1